MGYFELFLLASSVISLSVAIKLFLENWDLYNKIVELYNKQIMLTQEVILLYKELESFKKIKVDTKYITD